MITNETAIKMNSLSKIGTVWVIRGVASVAFGVLTLLQPGNSIAAIVFLYGLYALADGAFLLGLAFRQEGSKAPYIVRGLISVAAGALAFLYPGLTATSLYFLIGAWAIVIGALELGIAISLRKGTTSVGGLVLSGLLSIATGVALLALPVAGVVTLLSFIAAYAIINGIVLIVAGVRFHNVIRPLSAA
jgi:uncharacterized membrane protein HdeD (DUF308 family)